MKLLNQRATLLLISLLLTFIILRVFLYFLPSTNLDVGIYNIHHLYTGILLMMIGGIPLVILQGKGRILDAATIIFGIGLSLALDEWVYLIATDGSDTAYWLPVSVWGGVIMVGVAMIILIAVLLIFRNQQGTE